MKQLKFLGIIATTFIVLSSCDKDDDLQFLNPAPPVNIVKASGDLTVALADFRHLLGDSLNTVPGKTSGRREINWDGVAANLNNNDAFPGDFFNLTDPTGVNGRKRGLVYETDGTTFRVDSSDFAGIDPSYAAQFNPFSGKRLFSGANSNVTNIVFKIAGTTTPAVVKGFGVVFSDVDVFTSTTIECFNGNRSLGVYAAPIAGANSFSFLGVFFPTETITGVKITSGNAKLATGVKDISDGGSKDLVVMDDFFYSEPIQ